MDMVAIIVDAFAKEGIKVTATCNLKTVRVENKNVEGGFYEYLDSDTSITLEDGTTFTGQGVVNVMEQAAKHLEKIDA